MIIKDYIKKIENSDMSFWQAVLLFYGIVFIRTFLENYANSINFYHMSGFNDTFFHYPLFFQMILLSAIIVIKVLTKEEIAKIAKVAVFGSFILIMPPIIDLIVHRGGQIPYIFISGSYSQLFKSFLTYFGGSVIGIGIRTEVATVLIALGLYIFHKTKKIKLVAAGMLLLYLTIFMSLASPGLILGLKNIITGEYQPMNTDAVVNFYYYKEPINAMTSNRTFILDNNNFYPLSVQKVQNQYSITLSIIFLIINIILSGWCLFMYSSKKFFTVLKNFRYLRICHYFIMASIGVGLGIKILGKNPIGSLFDLMSFISLFLALFFAWLFSVWENDEVDIHIDKISNQERPLVEIEPLISFREWQDLKYVFLGYSLCFAFLNGLYSFIFILLFIFIYHIYSTPPLRLKRFLGISSLLIAVNALLAVWMGFFFSVGSENLSIFPAKYTFGILAVFLLAENVKNIKDMEGDKKNGIKTLPVVLGEKWGKLVVGLCLFLAALLVPFVIYFNLYTFLAAVCFGLILFLLTNRKNFKEKYVFLAYFAYMIVFYISMNL